MATQLDPTTEPDATVAAKLQAAAGILGRIAQGEASLPEWLPLVGRVIDAAEAQWNEAQR